MQNIIVKEKLDTLRNEMTHLWTAAFVLGGGSLTLSFTAFTPIRFVFSLLGIVLTTIFFNAYLIKRIEISKIINDMERRSHEH